MRANRRGCPRGIHPHPRNRRVDQGLPGRREWFQVVNAPNPGSEVDILASVAAAGDTLWSVGHFKDGGPRQSLIERHPPEER